MAKNRSLEQKKLKMKKRGRYARFSGGLTKVVHTKAVEVLDHKGEDKVTVRTVEVYVGPASFSKQVMSTGRGPNAERMQEYYQRVHSYDEALPKTLGLTEPMKEMGERYSTILREQRDMYINLVNNHTGRLDLFFNTTQWFFVDVDLQKKFWRRSRIYGSKEYALKMLTNKTVTWVETISSRKTAKTLELSGHPA